MTVPGGFSIPKDPPEKRGGVREVAGS